MLPRVSEPVLTPACSGCPCSQALVPRCLCVTRHPTRATPTSCCGMVRSVQDALLLPPRLVEEAHWRLCCWSEIVARRETVLAAGVHRFTVALTTWLWTCRSVRKHIGAFAAPDVIHWAPGLPKTRSGKIMRRILRKIAIGKVDELGDTSTLADPSIVETLIKLRPSA